MTTTTEDLGLQVDPILLKAVIGGTKAGLEMAAIKPIPVGASRFINASRKITTIIGCIGEYTGNLTFNLSEFVGLYLTEQMLGEKVEALNEEVLDAVGEVGNMIAGSVKDLLQDTKFAFPNISCPSVILGAQYDLYYYRGFSTVSVDFEIEQIPVIQMKDRFFSVAINLMRR